VVRGKQFGALSLLFVVPTALCLVGAGALLHVAARAAMVVKEDTAKKLEEVKQQAEALAKGIDELRDQIDAVKERVQQGKDRAEQAQRLQATLERLEEEKARLSRQLEELMRKLSELEKELGKQHEECRRLRRQLATARRKLEQLQRALQQMQPDPDGAGPSNPTGPSLQELAEAIAAAKAALEALVRDIEQAEAERDQLRQETDDPNIRVEEIVGWLPWQPPPRPLYVECDGQGVLLQPEGVRLPLWPSDQQEEQFVRTARQRRYVLFLIRPDGFRSFDRYRPLVKNNNVDYGYEPINQNGRVSYPEERSR